MRRLTRGCSSRKRLSRAVRAVLASVPTSASVTAPLSPSSAATASEPSHIEASRDSACGRKTRPASVSSGPPGRRSNSGAPSSVSSSRMRRLIAGWEKCSAAEARVKPPWRTIATNASTWSTSIRDADASERIYALDESLHGAYGAPMTHGAYVCLDEPAAIPALGLRNEFEPGDGDDTYALLRRVGATPAHIDDDPLL